MRRKIIPFKKQPKQLKLKRLTHLNLNQNSSKRLKHNDLGDYNEDSSSHA